MIRVVDAGGSQRCLPQRLLRFDIPQVDHFAPERAGAAKVVRESTHSPILGPKFLELFTGRRVALHHVSLFDEGDRSGIGSEQEEVLVAEYLLGLPAFL